MLEMMTTLQVGVNAVVREDCADRNLRWAVARGQSLRMRMAAVDGRTCARVCWRMV